MRVAIAVIVLSMMQFGVDLSRDVQAGVVTEPSSGYQVSMDMDRFMKRYEGMDGQVITMNWLDFVPLAFYSPSHVKITYPITPTDTFIPIAYRKLQDCCGAKGVLLDSLPMEYVAHGSLSNLGELHGKAHVREMTADYYTVSVGRD